jgi:hypothetical protein
MIPAGIPELSSDDDIGYLRDKLALDLDDAAAAKQIKKEIKKCLNDYYRLFDNFVVSGVYVAVWLEPLCVLCFEFCPHHSRFFSNPLPKCNL